MCLGLTLLLCRATPTPIPSALQALHSYQGKQGLWSLGVGGNVTLGIGRRSSAGLTLLFLGQCSALTVWSIQVQPREPVATLAITATFSGARTPGILTHMCCCLPSPHSRPRRKVGALLVTAGPGPVSLSPKEPDTMSPSYQFFPCQTPLPHGSCVRPSPRPPPYTLPYKLRFLSRVPFMAPVSSTPQLLGLCGIDFCA